MYFHFETPWYFLVTMSIAELLKENQCFKELTVWLIVTIQSEDSSHYMYYTEHRLLSFADGSNVNHIVTILDWLSAIIKSKDKHSMNEKEKSLVES